MAIIKYKVIQKNLEAVINYAKNGDKTEKGILVCGINCLPDTAYFQMMLTKKTFHKEDGRLGYHIIQSFNGKEVSPEKCNSIGVEFAQSLFGDKCQVLVCTHIDKENAIARNRTNNYNRNSGKMELIKNDIDEAIKNAKKYQDFIGNLAYKGYYVKKSNNVISVSTPYFNRNIRLSKAFGEDYTFENIKNRIYYRDYQFKEDKVYRIRIYEGVKINSELLKIP